MNMQWFPSYYFLFCSAENRSNVILKYNNKIKTRPDI